MTDEVIISIIVGAIVSIFSAWVGFLRAKTKIDQDGKIKEREAMLFEREQLAEQQNEFQNNMITQINNLRDSLLVEQKRNLKLQEQVNDYKRKYENLEQDWEEKYEKLNELWKEKYETLEKENRNLLQRIQELEKYKS